MSQWLYNYISISVSDPRHSDMGMNTHRFRPKTFSYEDIVDLGSRTHIYTALFNLASLPTKNDILSFTSNFYINRFIKTLNQRISHSYISKLNQNSKTLPT